MKKKLTREIDDREAGKVNMVLSMHNMSQTSLDDLSVEYNERSLIAKSRKPTNMFRKASGAFLRKS